MAKPRIKISSLLLCLGFALSATVLVGGAGAECMPSQQKEADLAYASAYESLKAENWAQAVPRLKSILEVCPSHINSLRGLGTAYLGLNELDQARETFIKLINARGDEAEAGDFANLGKTYAKLKDYQQARGAYLKASALDPDNCSILFNLGVLHVGVQDYRSAVEAFEHTLEECPAVREQVLSQLAKACQKAATKEKSMGNPDREQLYLAKYKQYAGLSGEGSTKYDLIRKLMKEGKYNEAIPLLEELVAENPDHHPGWLSLARCLDQVERNNEAINAYQKRLELRPDDEKTTADLIILYAETERCQEAIRLAQMGKDRFQSQGKEHLAGIYFGWGMALSCAKEYEAAKEKFRSSIASGVSKWSEPARQQIRRQDELIEFEALKKKKEAQGR